MTHDTQTQDPVGAQAPEEPVTKAVAPKPTLPELMAKLIAAQDAQAAARAAAQATDEAKAYEEASKAYDAALNALTRAIPRQAGVGLVLDGYEAKWAGRTTTHYDVKTVENVIRTLLPEGAADKVIAQATKTLVGVGDLQDACRQAVAEKEAPPDLLEKIAATGVPQTTLSFTFKPLPKSRGGAGKGA